MMKIIKYRNLESGKATDFSYDIHCPIGWKAIILDENIRRLEDIDPAKYHEQKYSDHLISIEYREKRVNGSKNHPTKLKYQYFGDQLDAIFKGLQAIRDGNPLPQATLDWLAHCEAVKQSWPKV